MTVLDTHTWLWWIDDPNRLSAPARKEVETASEIVVNAISFMEVATLVRLGRLKLDRATSAWLANASADGRIVVADVDSEIAARAGALPDPFPGDPADRLIYATAVVRGVRLITRDRAIREFDPLRTVW